MSPLIKILPATLFFFSGCASLIFETLCSRRLALVIGNTVQSASATVSAFLFGLGVGAHLGAILVRKAKNPLRVFALLEASAGIGALFVLAVIPRLPVLLGPLANFAPGLLPLARVVLVFALLLLPACAMGASLPVLSQYYVENLQARFTASLGSLYAVNTLGAASGVMLADFFLVQRIGVTKTGWVSSALYLLVAGFSLFLAQAGSPEVVERECSETESSGKGIVWPGVSVLAVSGFCGLTYQVLWTRMLTFFNGNDVLAFSTTLSVYLLGLVLGSALAASPLFRKGLSDRTLAWILSLLGLTAYLSLFTVSFVRALRETLESHGASFTMANLVACGAVMLPSAVCLGLLFPLAAHRIKESSEQAASVVGRAYVFSTLGSVLGGLLAGFGLLPVLGLQRSLAGTAAIAIAWGAILLFKLPGRKVKAAFVPLLFLGVLLATPPDFLLRTVYQELYPSIIYSVDDHYGSIALSRTFDPVLQAMSENLLVDGFNMAGNTPTAKSYTTGLAALPILLCKDPKKVLIVCMGLGNTLNTALSLSQTESVQCVELSTQIPKVLRLTEIGPRVLDHPKLMVEQGDGRNHLLYTHAKYDVISAEPPPPTHAGIVNLYSREYYELCATRLNEGGVVAQWLPVFQLTEFETKTIIRAFQDIFPETYLWESESSQLCLIGSLQAIEWDFPALKQRLKENEEFLKEADWESPYLFAALYIAGPQELRAYTEDIPPLTDDWPRIQYSDGKYLIDKEFLFFSARERSPGWELTDEERLKIATNRKAILARHLYASKLDQRYARRSDLEYFDLGNLSLGILPGNQAMETRFLVTKGRLESTQGDVDQNPQNVAALQDLARIHFLLGHLPEALEWVERGAELESPRQNFLRLFAILIKFRMGQKAQARTEYEALSSPESIDSDFVGRVLQTK